MKKIYFLLLLSFLAVISCSKETLPAVSPALDVNVVDNGFMAQGQTKTSESGLNTSFTEGDKIGIFGVCEGSIADNLNNLCLTASMSDGKLVWTPENGAVVEKNPDMKYFAYYPYDSKLSASLNPNAGNAESFFSELIEGWTPSGNQGTAYGYSSSDLMVADGIVINSTLNFTMKHQMALISIDLPKRVYKFTNTPAIPDYSLPLSGVKFDGFTPKQQVDATYSYIVNPKAGKKSLKGSYDFNGQTREWSFEAAGEAGKVTVYRIDKSFASSDTEFLLQVGDFFLSDGSLLSKDAPLETVQAADVVGIVFQIDQERIGQGEKDALGGKAHALVLSTKNVGGELGYFEWYYNDNKDYIRDETEIGLPNISSEDAFETYRLSDSDIEGYRNYSLIMNNRTSDVEAGFYPVFGAVSDFADEVGGDYSGNTGWFIPSCGQWFDVIRNLGNAELTDDTSKGFVNHTTGDISWGGRGQINTSINEYMTKVADANKHVFKAGGYNYFWTSSQANSERARYVGISNDVAGIEWTSVMCVGDYKKTLLNVRAVLAF